MKTRHRACRVVFAAIVVLAGVTAVSADPAPELRWQPVGSSDSFQIIDNTGTPGTPSEILIPVGNITVTIELKVSGWGLAPGNPVLGAYQGTLNSAASYDNGVGATIGPLNPLTNDGGFMDLSRPDFVFFGISPLVNAGTFSLDYEWGSTCMGAFPSDDGTIKYGGTLILDLPAGAKGTYEIQLNPDPAKTFMNNGIAEQIPGMAITPALVTVVTGKCCYNIGDISLPCADGITEAECDMLTDPGRVYTFFRDGLCPPAGSYCCNCSYDGDCNDGNDCTLDWCGVGAECYCHTDPIYDVATECCDPAGAALTPIDDGLPCTEDVCDPNTGEVAHNALPADSSCDDGNPCSVDDVCDGTTGTTACSGSTPEAAMIACPGGDFQCPAGWFCEMDPIQPMFGYCDCSLETPLCIGFDGVCYEEGDPVIASVAIGAGSAIVTSGQFLMTYDPTCLEFVEIGPCEGDGKFLTVVDYWVDEIAGKIWYAVLAYNDGDHTTNYGTVGPYDLACIEFVKLGNCEPCDVCLISENPYNTLLGDYHGENVPLDNCGCSAGIVLDGEVTIVCPSGADVNVDCGVVDAEVLWDPPYAEDECLGALDVVCIAEHDGGLPISQDMIMHGGNFPQGTTFFECSAENECGSYDRCLWWVTVSDKQTLDVEVDLSPAVVPNLTRCIMFDLIYNCAAPQTVCAEVTFGPPYNFPNHGTATLDVDKGNFECVEARDPLHTLRSFSDIECDEVTGNWKVVFKGDPLTGGNWLVPGSLDFYQVGDNGPNHVDALDFGVYMWQLGADYGTGDTACGADCALGSFANADLNGDGMVDAIDFGIIENNFMAQSKLGCCGYATAGAFEPVLDISVKELIRDGRGELAAGDINNDGRLNLDDMALYAQGGVQITKAKRIR